MKNNYGILLIKGELKSTDSPISDFSETELGKKFLELLDTTKIPYFDIVLSDWDMGFKGFVPLFINYDVKHIIVESYAISTDSGYSIQLRYDIPNDTLYIQYDEV